MQNLDNLDVFEILITQKLLNALRTLLSDPGSYNYLKIFKQFNLCSPGPDIIKLFSCLTQLSTKYILLINAIVPTIVSFLTLFIILA